MLMRRRILILVVLAVLSFVAANLAEGQRTLTVRCSIPKAYGTFKAAVLVGGGGVRMIFEDPAGIIRIMDTECRTEFAYDRQ